MTSYARNTIASKNPLKRWLHRQRFAASLRLLDLHPQQRFLDYGCGDGQLAYQIRTQCTDTEVVAFDPATDLYTQAVEMLKEFPDARVVGTVAEIPGSFDRVACLETIEHLPERELQKLFSAISQRLNTDGYCLFTFPVEHGLASLCKNCYRMLTKRDKYVSMVRAIRSLLSLPVPREPAENLSDCSYIYSHIGFDCREMIDKIAEYFVVDHVSCLPFGMILCGLTNSVAVVARKRS